MIWTAKVAFLKIKIYFLKSTLDSGFSTLCRSHMYPDLRLRLVKPFPARAIILNDGNRHTCKKCAVTFSPRLDSDLYLRLRHLLEIISQSEGRANPAIHFAVRRHQCRWPRGDAKGQFGDWRLYLFPYGDGGRFRPD